MQLIFNNLDELNDMLKAMGYVRRDTIAELTCGEITLRGSEQFEKDLTDSGQFDRAAETALRDVDNLPDDGVPEPATSGHTPEPAKRKRRTKAEIEAEKAAQSAAAIVVATETGDEPSVPQTSPLDNLKAEPAVASNGGQARAEIAEMAALFDGADRLAHINEGRDFIAKHGFPTYHETMQLADVPANIAGHTPEQVSRHRAAMAWKATQLAGG